MVAIDTVIEFVVNEARQCDASDGERRAELIKIVMVLIEFKHNRSRA